MLRTSLRMSSSPNELTGATSRRHLFKNSGMDEFVLKDIPKDIFSNFTEIIRPRLRESPYIRLPFDNIPGHRIFVYRYLIDDFLSLVRKHIPMRARKQILKASLLGIVELHERDIAHLDIKPDNIMANYSSVGNDIAIQQVQLIDLENAAYLPKGRCIKGMLAGNDNWRSPEAHFKGELNKPTGIFFFGAVCIYAVVGRVIFGPDEDFRKHEAQGALPVFIRFQRQVSYFGDKEGLHGLIKHVGDEEVNSQVLKMLWEERTEEHIPYEPFSRWPDISDTVFKDFVQKTMNLDPARRITARQALEHPWLANVEIS
ncbi:putative calcium/calmodulin dependent protein kinase [Lineolata rhizophorae]|uniref:Putative calcium/calmodulin dependent protein kinase n=1 Tax=Lineolata rhizophorae TaxID=578093 RepID=A0A6A6NM28_9PEZI|nr:putative calcium/calmodulin dependent protein kinase [Lineolata rhizophorae]